MSKTVQFILIALLLVISVLFFLILTEGSSTENSVGETKPTETQKPSEVVEEPRSIDAFDDVVPTTPGEDKSDLPSEGTEVTPPGAQVELTGTTWQWQYTEGPGRSILSNPPADNPFIITFGPDGSMSSQTDCNAMGGTYTVNGENLSFMDIFATQMYCENSLENEYQSQLILVEKFVLEENVLQLQLEGGQGTMLFASVE